VKEGRAYHWRMLINDADRWRRRAEEARALAEQLNGYQARMAMLAVADDYDKIARRSEGRSDPDERPTRQAQRAEQEPSCKYNSGWKFSCLRQGRWYLGASAP
jgi:hypothetical protein